MTDVLTIKHGIVIPLSEIELTAVRSRGAGGQNVNKVASAIHLRFDIRNSTALPQSVKQRLLAFGDRRISKDGVLIIKAQEYRTQERNRQAALNRLQELLRFMLVEQTPRKKSRLPGAIKKKRIALKRHRGELKRSRSRLDEDS